MQSAENGSLWCSEHMEPHCPRHSAEFDVRPGVVVRYKPDPSRHDPRWCREGMAIADSAGVLFDTYWQSGNESHRLLPVELATIELLFHMDDYDELDRCSQTTKGLWATYHPDDRHVVTSQHRLQFRWFIRKGARPDIDTQIENAEEKVRECESRVESARQQLEWAQHDLDALNNRVFPPGATD